MNTILKQYNLLILIAILGVTFFTSCVDEEFSNKNKIKEGIPVGLTLSFTQSDIANIETKADIGNEEKNVYDIRLFIFNSQKQLEYTELIENESNEALNPDIAINIPEGSLTSGEKYIYAIANTSSSLGAFSQELNNVKSISDLTTLTYTMKSATEQRLSGRLLMGGFYTEDGQTGDGFCLVDADKANNGIVSLSGKISLVRVDSKIKFNVTANDGITFVPKKWKVVNMPTTTSVFGSTYDATGSYAMSGLNEFDDSNIENTQYKGGNFTFYMFENRKAPSDGIRDYFDRERESEQGATKTADPRDYIYANENSAYVVLSGSYRGTNEEDGKEVSAEVEYRIHLGFVNEVATDFSSERNKNYTYKVTVEGVKKIIVEVDEGTEKQPGAEGDVIIADQNILVDAHYEAQVITFSRDALADLSVQVNTPFDNGTYSIKNGAVEKDYLGADYEWVKFVRNEKVNGIYSTKLALYPGDQNHAKTEENEGLISVSQGVDETKNYLTIKELLWHLQNNKDTEDFWDLDGKVCYTAFIDEYYYDEDPNTGISSTTLWKKFANAPNRKMHILCDTKYSPDKQSSLTRSTILINQRSIKTVYNLDVNLNYLATAWGIETVDETPDNYFGGDRTNKASLTNGRYMTFLIAGDNMLNKNWDAYVDFSSTEKQKLKDLYKKAEYACMQRNRDLDGNGTVSSDEIRWYLPALNQYTALWIGKDALDPEARLFQVNPENVIRDPSNKPELEPPYNETPTARAHFHYISSNGIRFWSEQGAATGNTVWTDHKFPYKFRCARNLGFSYDGESEKNKSSEDIKNENYVDYVQYEIGTDGKASKIDLTYLNPVAKRSILETNQLAENGEHKGADLNRPYNKFEVYSKNSLYNECPKGWRIPNQREISLIAGYSSTSFADQISSNTYTNLTDASYNNKRELVYAINGNIISLDGDKTKTRCVRDADM